MINSNSPSRTLSASLIALLVAVALLVTIVLPAEYGWDPLGSGAALGLLGLSQERTTPLTPRDEKWRSDRIAFKLLPFEAVEYKYRLEGGATVLFDWHAEDAVVFDLHAEPDGAAPGYAESFAKGRSAQGSGSYRAPFPGIHGWFWQNRGQREITVTLETQGYYSAAQEMRDGNVVHYEFASPATQQAQP